MSAVAAEVVVTFDRETDAPAAGCAALVSTGGRSLGSGAACDWNAAADQLTIRLGSGAALSAGDNITFLGTIGAKDKNSLFVTSSHRVVSLAQAQLVAPPQINSCGATSLLLSAAASSGGAGQPLNFSWAVSPADSSPLAALVAAAADSTLLVPAGNMSNGQAYTFSVTVRNVDGYSSTASRTVTKVDDTQRPTVSIVNPAPLATFAYKPTTLQGSVSFSACASDRQLAFAWTSSPALPGLATNGRDLFLPAYTMQAGVSYVLSLRASLLAPPHSSSTSTIAVNVAASAPQARIAGGSRQVAVTDAVRLDASASVDRDVGNSTDALTFTWTCREQQGNGTSGCIDGNSGGLLVLPPTAVVDLPPNTFATGRRYSLAVTVTKAPLSDEASVTLSVTTGAPPLVAISPLGVRAVNPSGKLVLQCTASSRLVDKTVGYSWSAVGGSGALTLDDSTLLSARSSRFLVVAPNVLQPGEQYTFRCTATDRDGVQGFAELTAPVNAPPRVGTLRVWPESGMAVNTSFTLRADSWSDDPADYPLSYRFSYYIGTDSHDDVFLGAAALLNTLDAARVNQLNETSNVTFVVRVSDALGAVATASYTVQVVPANVVDVSAFATSYLDSSVADARANGNLDEMAAGINLIASVMNGAGGGLVDEATRAGLQAALLGVLQQAAANVSLLPADVAELQISAVSSIVVDGVQRQDDQRGAMEHVRQLLQSADGSSDTVSRGVGGLLDGVLRSLATNGSAVPLEVAQGVYETASALFEAQLSGQVCGETGARLQAERVHMLSQRSPLLAAPLSFADGGLVTFGTMSEAASADGCFTVQALVVGYDLHRDASSRKRNAPADAALPDSVGSVVSVNVFPNTVDNVNITFALSDADFAQLANTTAVGAVCRYRDGVTSDWVSDESCAFVGLQADTRRVTCHCTHLTDFSVKPVKKEPTGKAQPTPVEEPTLSAKDLIIIIVPVGVAIIGIVVATITAALCMRRMRSRSLMVAPNDNEHTSRDEFTSEQDKPAVK
eukprot:TRINITY_DN260_c0_g1_i2.p1 TRINITY_DN260_c0_g1~~TRINITY_DN260_c0_g1_i2.p1  ORF type:complete len:1015 (-),score=488.94 TRINITY_DN260_c0_g1_i2:491-3535(-)